MLRRRIIMLAALAGATWPYRILYAQPPYDRGGLPPGPFHNAPPPPDRRSYQREPYRTEPPASLHDTRPPNFRAGPYDRPPMPPPRHETRPPPPPHASERWRW